MGEKIENLSPEQAKQQEEIAVAASGEAESFASVKPIEPSSASASGAPTKRKPSAAPNVIVADFGATADAYVQARNLKLKSIRGTVYSDVTVDVQKGQVLAIRGHEGAGKTSLLLTLAGRMKPSSGTLTVGEWSLPKQRHKASRHIGLGLFAGLNDLQGSLPVKSVLKAEFELYNRKARKEAVADYLATWNLADVSDMRVTELSQQRRVHLGVALAFVGSPSMICVDDIESNLTKEQSEELMRMLKRFASEQNVVVAVGVIERDLAAMADVAVYLEAEGGR